MDALTAHRFQFAFTIVYHYLFPQLTMGLALLIVVLKTQALRGNDVAEASARFWARVLGVNFVFGVVTGIPMEFQFGTNWSRFSSAAGGIIGQTLAMEGVFAFFLESSFLYLLLFGEKQLGPRLHWLSAVLVFVGSWASGWFIVATNAFMQHPVGHEVMADGTIVLRSVWALLTNPWAVVQYAHTMIGSVITASFVMAGVGAFYLLMQQHPPHARQFLRVGVIAGLIASILAAVPSGDSQAKLVARHQPAAFAAMEGLFTSAAGAELALIGQPDMERLTLDNPIAVPKLLSFLTHKRWNAPIVGLQSFERDLWPDNVPLLYYGYHVMAGLGTIFIVIMVLSAVFLWRGTLWRRRAMLWTLMLGSPLPYIANTAGWMTAELGRQPWLIHGLMRTRDGSSPNVAGGSVTFTLIGFMGLYALLSLLFVFVVGRLIVRGPAAVGSGH